MLQTLWIKFKKPRYEHHINQTVVTLNPAFFYDLRFLCNCTLIFLFLFQKVLYSLIKDFFFLMDYVKIPLTKLMDNGKNLLPKYDCKHISFLSKIFFKTLLWLFALYYTSFFCLAFWPIASTTTINATIFVSSVICHCFWLVQ